MANPKSSESPSAPILPCRGLSLLLATFGGMVVGLAFPEMHEDARTSFLGWYSGQHPAWDALVPVILLPAGILSILAFHFPDRRAAFFYAPLFYCFLTVALFFGRIGGWPPWPQSFQALYLIPHIAIPLGLGVVVLTPTMMLVAALRRGYLRSHSGLRCFTCGYMLLGNTSGICPECGRSFSPGAYGLTEADVTPTDPDSIARVMAVPHPADHRYGLGLQLLLVVVACVGADLGVVQMTPPGPQIHVLWWTVALLAAAASSATALRAYRRSTRRKQFRFTHIIAAAITAVLAVLVSFHQVETLGTDMWVVPHRRVSFLREELGLAFGFVDGRPTASAPARGQAMDANPPDLKAPSQFNATVHDSKAVPVEYGPYYQRYLNRDHLERIGYRPTPTWTYDPGIILVYTPRPIMIRRWFRPVPDAWVAFHGDGRCVTYRTAADLRQALEEDNRTRAARTLPQMVYEVFDR
jgi:hypothetical protein